jgi:hypothetical protein
VPLSLPAFSPLLLFPVGNPEGIVLEDVDSEGIVLGDVDSEGIVLGDVDSEGIVLGIMETLGTMERLGSIDTEGLELGALGSQIKSGQTFGVFDFFAAVFLNLFLFVSTDFFALHVFRTDFLGRVYASVLLSQDLETAVHVP